MALASQLTHRLLENVALPYKSFTSPIDASPQFVAGKNVLGSLKGICVQRPGFSDYLESAVTDFHNVQRIFGWTRWDGTTEVIMLVDIQSTVPKVYKFIIGTDTSFVLIHTGTAGADPYDFVAENNLVYFSNGTDAYKWSPTLGKQLWGIVTPAAPTLTFVGGSLSAFAGGWFYSISYKNSVTGHVSSPSPLSASTGNISSQNVHVAWAASSDSQVDRVVIWRTTDGGSQNPQQMAQLADVAVGASPYTDSTPDSGLSATSFAPAFYQNDPPPPIKGMQSYAGRVWGFTGARMWYSGQEEISQGVPQECFPGASISALDGNFYAFARALQAIAPLPDGVAVLSPDPIYKIEGDSLDTFRRYTLLQRRGTTNRQTVTAVGSSVVWLDSSSQLWLSDTGEISKDIRPDVAAIPQATAVSTVHISKDEHWVVLLDGSTGIIYVYDLDLSQWNVPWPLMGGASIVSSIETSPGTRKLAAAIDGKHVCLLNPGLYLDEGQEYSAWVCTNPVPVAPQTNPEFIGQLEWVSVESNQYQPSVVSICTDEDPIGLIAANPSSQETGGLLPLTTSDPPSRRHQGTYLKEIQYKGVPDPSAPPCRRVAVRLDWMNTESPAIWAWYSIDLALTPFGK